MSMRTYLYNSGLNLLKAQDGEAYRLLFTGFKVSSRFDIDFDPLDNTLPNTVFTGTTDDMTYSPISDNEAIIQCKVDHSVVESTLASVQLLVDGQPFSISIPATDFFKPTTIEDQAVGSKYFFRIMINIPALLERISFANLNEGNAVFKTVASEQAMPLYPWEEPADQLTIHRHSKTGALTFVLNAWGDFWGCPVAQKIEGDDGFWHIDGGVAGDNHKYTG